MQIITSILTVIVGVGVIIWVDNNLDKASTMTRKRYIATLLTLFLVVVIIFLAVILVATV